MQRLLLLCAIAASACGHGSSSMGDDDDGPHPDAVVPADGHAEPDGGGSGTCAAVETCDGVIDDDCDGTVDEGCGRCPLLSIACPAGCCPVDRWEVASTAAMGTSIAVDDAGDIFVAYTANGPVHPSSLAIYSAVPGTWRTVSLGGGSYRNRVHLDALGRLHVLSQDSSYVLTYRRSDDHGATFTAPVTVAQMNGNEGFDIATDSTGQPHVVYLADSIGSSFGEVVYAHLVGSTWQRETLDTITRGPEYPTIALGFADRPTIVVEAYQPGGMQGTGKRSMFYNGNRWIIENIDLLASGSTYSSDGYFAAQSLRIAADDSRDVMFSRKDAGTDRLYLAHRGPGDTDAWHVSQVTGASSFTTPTMFVDAHGALGAVSDGLTVHRLAGTTATSTPVGIPGSDVAVARRGRYLYLAYNGGPPNNAPTVTVVDLGD